MKFKFFEMTENRRGEIKKIKRKVKDITIP